MNDILNLSDIKTRTKCPFYGFSYMRRTFFMDSEGNQCALRAGYSPCKMEMAGQVSFLE
ncbi:hypothetical protein BMS3Abin17_01380 [archaeon BMS3Abin17]|nr:hypothetical protein BMS3Abin17_01380 [archaeon BMS3Abin17]